MKLMTLITFLFLSQLIHAQNLPSTKAYISVGTCTSTVDESLELRILFQANGTAVVDNGLIVSEIEDPMQREVTIMSAFSTSMTLDEAAGKATIDFAGSKIELLRGSVTQNQVEQAQYNCRAEF